MAGRVLSKENESKLRSAAATLASILALLDKEGKADGDEAKEARRLLTEAANLGNWLESRLHLTFTELTDNLFGEGRLTREERIGLSGAIGEALSAFNAAVMANLPGIYEREPWRDAPVPAAVSEAAIEADFVPLLEKAVRRDGTVPLKLIQPGWGASGYYGADVLERDGPQVFRKGLKQYWNHATPTEEAERPEGDLRNLAAELVSDARYDANGAEGPGLYADAKVFGPYREAINELAPHIGVSIRALGRAVQGEAEGRTGPIIQAITDARSVDYVTQPGAGGKVLEMFEAARATTRQASAQLTLPHLDTQEKDTVNEQQFQEAVTRLEEQNRAITAQNQELAQQNARLSEAMLLRDARAFASDRLQAAQVPDVTRTRLVESLSANPPVKDGQLDTATYGATIDEAVKTEIAYLTQAAGYGAGRVEGMGSVGATGNEAAGRAALVEAFKFMGLDERSALLAAEGR